MIRLLQLAQELDWQVLELRRFRYQELETDGLEELTAEQQNMVIATADKIQRELLGTVRFDPLRLVGVGGPISATLDSMGDLLLAIDEIRRDAATDVHSLPSAVRSLQGLLKGFCEEGTPVAA